MTDEQIAALSQAAGVAGDLEQVDVCRRALDGDEEARRECERVLADAAAQRRVCARCGVEFEPIERIADRQRVCAGCVLLAIDEHALDALEHMTDEEIEAELREDGVDVEALRQRMLKTVEDFKARVADKKASER